MNREIKFRAWDYSNKYMVYDDKGLTVGKILDRFDVVMQYTGLKDKNGVEIWEGDKVTGIHTGEIMYEEDFAGFMIVCEWSKHQYMFRLGCDVAMGSKVIGNIYEGGGNE